MKLPQAVRLSHSGEIFCILVRQQLDERCVFSGWNENALSLCSLLQFPVENGMRIVKCHAGTVYTQNFLSYSHVVLLTRRAIHHHIQLLMCTMPCPTRDFIGTLIMCPFLCWTCFEMPNEMSWIQERYSLNKWERHALWKWYFHWPVWISFWVMTIWYLQKIHVTAWVCRDRSFKQPVLTWSCGLFFCALHSASLAIIYKVIFDSQWVYRCIFYWFLCRRSL